MTQETPAPTFAELGLGPVLQETLTTLGYEEPTPIQAEAIPQLLAGKDMLGQAATGTGKTAAFALPILHQLIDADRGLAPTALILVPTRELCMQVSTALHRYGRAVAVRGLPIYGGQPIGRQLRELERGVDVVVATPGRAVDHLNRGSLDLSSLRTVVLDEADEMLDMGFAEDLETILSATPRQRQTVMFSATLPARINAIARVHLTDPVRIEIGRAQTGTDRPPLVTQRAYVVPRAQKAAALCRVLDVESPTAAFIFCRTRSEVDELAEILSGRGYRSEALHGGMDQVQRDRVMGRVRSGATDLLVATDVAARGLDIDHLTHVFNYDVPSAPESYQHRIGRVGRGGREGTAITLAEPREHRMLKTIERVTKQHIQIGTVPSTADLRARRLELTRAALEEILQADDYEQYRVVVDTLSDEFDVVQVAMAAVQAAHEALRGPMDTEEIRDASVPPERSARTGRPPVAGGGGGDGRSAGRGGPRGRASGMARIFIGAGRQAGLRPQDVVGAIANETSISGRQIGAIDIADRFTLVDVPEESAAEVIRALNSTRLKGNKVRARRDAGR
jgi:ATP-dependent RNA helicase DeaD